MKTNFDITHEQAVEAGSICGALLFGYLWQLQHESSGAITLPIRAKSNTKKYLSAREAADRLGVGKSKFYEMRAAADFPKKHASAGGPKYLTVEIDRYGAQHKNKKA